MTDFLPSSKAMLEYVIYTYQTYDETQFGVNKWQRFKTVKGLNRAITEAKALHRSQKFQKIEVKQRFFDETKGRMLSKTLKVFRNRSINIFKGAFKNWVSGAVIGFAAFSFLITVLQ